MLVGGHQDNAVDLCGEDNTDTKHQCLDKGQTMLTKYPHIQCFTCPTHGIYGFIQTICVSKEEIQMQRNEMGGVGVQHVAWDEDFLEKAFAQALQCIQAVTAHQKPLARFRVIAESLPANEQIAGGTEPKKYGETRCGSREQ